MTKSEALEKSASVVAALWPKWWKPGRICKQRGYHGFRFHEGMTVHGDLPHEIPPPNLLQAGNFVRTLKAAQRLIPLLDCAVDNQQEIHFVWGCKLVGQEWAWANTPEEALLLALYDLVTQEKR